MGLVAAREHQRDDQRHLDHRDRHRQHQRAVGLADAVGHDLGVVHRGQHRADQRHSHDHQAPDRQRAAPGERQRHQRDDRQDQAPERQR
jgi:hypothetical protein